MVPVSYFIVCVDVRRGNISLVAVKYSWYADVVFIMKYQTVGWGSWLQIIKNLFD